MTAPTFGLPSPSIHRYQLAVTDEQTLRMPAGARLLHVAAFYVGVGTGNPRIELWCHVDLEQPDIQRRFRVIGTGHLADVDPGQYVGTVIHELDRGRGVWHVFDLGEVTA